MFKIPCSEQRFPRAILLMGSQWITFKWEILILPALRVADQGQSLREPQNSSVKRCSIIWDSQKTLKVQNGLLVMQQSLLAARTGGPSRTCCSPTMFWLWPRCPSGHLVLQPAEITLLPLNMGSTKGVNFLGSQESGNVDQNKVGVQLGQDTPAVPEKIPKSLCSYILSLSILLQ